MFSCASVDAIRKIKAMYRVKKNWQGDPCVPLDYSWEGLNCENRFIVRVLLKTRRCSVLLVFVHVSKTALVSCRNLSFSGLSGLIDPAFCNLTSIQKLSVFICLML